MRKLTVFISIIFFLFILAACDSTAEVDSSMQSAEPNTDTANDGASADWPSNNVYASKVPQPNFSILSWDNKVGSREGFTVNFSNVTADQIKYYAKQIEEAGFDNSNIVDKTSENDPSFQLLASDPQGCCLQLIWENDEAELAITKFRICC